MRPTLQHHEPVAKHGKLRASPESLSRTSVDPALHRGEPARLELEFLNRVIAWETSPVSTHRDWLARHRLRHLRRATGESRPDATTRRTDDENGAFWDETPS